MIQVTPEIEIDENEFSFEYVRSSGPGGQHVNKTSTAVQLRFDVKHSPSLPGDVCDRLTRLAGKKITEAGIIIIDARRYRSQIRNRDDAIERLILLIQKASIKPVIRKKTKLSKAARKRRLEKKRIKGQLKKLRKRVSRHDE